MRVGVIGLAGVGRTHINKWSEIAELVSVCDLDSTVLAQVTKSYQINGYTNVEQMLDKEDLQAISVCTPPKSPSFNHATGRRPWNSCLVRKADG